MFSFKTRPYYSCSRCNYSNYVHPLVSTRPKRSRTKMKNGRTTTDMRKVPVVRVESLSQLYHLLVGTGKLDPRAAGSRSVQLNDASS